MAYTEIKIERIQMYYRQFILCPPMYSNANLFQQCLLLAYLHFIKRPTNILYMCSTFLLSPKRFTNRNFAFVTKVCTCENCSL